MKRNNDKKTIIFLSLLLVSVFWNISTNVNAKYISNKQISNNTSINVKKLTYWNNNKDIKKIKQKIQKEIRNRKKYHTILVKEYNKDLSNNKLLDKITINSMKILELEKNKKGLTYNS